MSQFKSLFLPLREEEEAVFASVFPLLLTLPSAIEGEAAAAAGEHRHRHHTPLTTAGGSAQSPYSPAEGGSTTATAASGAGVSAGNYIERGGVLASPRESAEAVQARRGAPLRSLVFAVGSARADALLVVLRSAHVVVFGLDRPHSPPYELYRIRPLPTTQQLQVAREAAQHKSHSRTSSNGGGDGSGAAAAVATCASLLPLSISYCCRIVVPSGGRNPRTNAHGSPSSSASLSAAPPQDEIYLRGLVGCSDGRISLFSDVAYTLSFAAHETAVVQVNAVLLPPCTVTGVASAAAAAAENAMSRPASPAQPAPSPPPPPPQQASSSSSSSRRDLLQRAMGRLGIVSIGADGVVLLWRRLDGAMTPVVLLRPSSFARRVPCAVHYPSALSALLSATAPRSSREAAIDAELCCPPSCVVHATSQHAHGLRVRQLASLASHNSAAATTLAGGAATPTTTTNVASGAHGQTSTSTTAAAGMTVEAAERAAPTWLRLPMPGSWTAAVTAMASHNGLTLIAREASLFSIVRFDARAATRVWKAESPITEIVLQDTLAIAVCAKAGAVHVLTLHPVTGQDLHQRAYYSYKNRAIQHVSLHEASLLMTIVDVCGSTELVQLPRDVLLHQHLHPLHGGCTPGSGETIHLLASMAALRAKVSIEDVKGAEVGPDALGGATSMYEANAALDQLNESLLLARCAVPEECDRFMAPNEHVF